MNRNRHRPGYLPAKMLQRSECCGDVRLLTKQNNNNQTVGYLGEEYNQRINERRRGLLMLYRRRGEKLYARMFATSVPRSQASASARKTAGTFSAKGIQQHLSPLHRPRRPLQPEASASDRAVIADRSDRCTDEVSSRALRSLRGSYLSGPPGSPVRSLPSIRSNTARSLPIPGGLSQPSHNPREDPTNAKFYD